MAIEQGDKSFRILNGQRVEPDCVVLAFPKEKNPDWISQTSGKVTYPIESKRRSIEIGFSKFTPTENHFGSESTETESQKTDIFLVNGFSIDNGIKPMQRFCQELATQCNADVFSLDAKPERFRGDPNDDEGEAISRFIKDTVTHNPSTSLSEQQRKTHIIIAGHSRGNMAAIKAYARLQKEIDTGTIKDITLDPLVVTHYVDRKSLPELVTNSAVDFTRSLKQILSPDEGTDRLHVAFATLEVYGAAFKKQMENVLESKIRYPQQLVGELVTLCKGNPATKEIQGPVIIKTGLKDPHTHPGRGSGRTFPERLLGRNEYTEKELSEHYRRLFPNSSVISVDIDPNSTHITPVINPKEYAKEMQQSFTELRRRQDAQQIS